MIAQGFRVPAPSELESKFLKMNFSNLIPALRDTVEIKKPGWDGDNVFEGKACAFTFYRLDIIYRFQLSEGGWRSPGTRRPWTQEWRR